MSEDDGPSFEVRKADWLDAEYAQRRILDSCAPLPEEHVPLAETLGRALARDLDSEITLPPWDNAAMDGYAVRGQDIEGATETAPVTLPVNRRVRAGEVAGERLEPGHAVRIMTGAPVPSGSDSVVRVEDTDAEATPGLVRVASDRDREANIRPRGQDLRPGERVLSRGDVVHPGTIGVLATLGQASVWVHRQPTVAILTTGDELRAVEQYQDVRSGTGIPESNGPMIAAAVTASGGVPRLLGIVPDSTSALSAALDRAAGSDVVVTVGGASMGEADLVKRVLDGAGFRQDFWRVRMRPGSPFGFGWLPGDGGDTPVFGLPGNPSSAYVTFEIFVRPFLLRLGGHRNVHRARLTGRAGETLRGSKRTLFLRVRMENSDSPPLVRLTGPQGSGLVRGLAPTEGLAVVPAGAVIAEGDPVDVLLLNVGPAPCDVSPLEGLDV